MIATVRDGRLIHLRGNPEAPTNRGKICPKAHAGVYKLYHPERLGFPLMRAGARGEGRWRRITWDRAFAVITRNLRAIIDRHGARSVALWQNVDHDRPDIFKRFIYALGSPNYFDHPGSSSTSLAAGLAMGPVNATLDYAHSETIFIVGTNPLACKELCWSARELIGAKHRGATLIVADPRLSETAMHATPGLWLPIRPGTDGILLAGLANHLIQADAYDHDFIDRHTFGFTRMRARLEQFTVDRVCQATDIPREQFLRAAASMVGKRTAIDAMSGLAFQQNGTLAGTMRIILAALLGSIDREGGILPLPFPRVTYPEVEPTVSAPSIERIDRGNMGRIPLPFGPRPEHLSFNGIGPYLLENIAREQPYPLKALILCSTNPAYSLADSDALTRAFDNLDLLVTIDAFMSETSVYADIVLPGATFLETHEINDVFPPYRGAVMRKPVVKPRMQSRGSQDIIIDLAKALGLQREFEFASYEAFLQQQLVGSELDYEQLHDRGFVDLGYEIGETLTRGFGTPSRRIELYGSVLAYSGIDPLPAARLWDSGAAPADFPLFLISYRLPFHANSRTASNAYLSAIQNENPLLLNTETAKRLGIVTGDMVRVESQRGAVSVRAAPTEGIHPQTVALSYHFGHRAYAKLCQRRGAWFNQVASIQLDPVSFNATYNTHVRVSKV